MELFKVVLFALLTVVAVVITRQFNGEFALVVTVCATVLLAIFVCDKLFDVVQVFYGFSQKAGIDSQSVNCVVKVVGIGYLAEFANSLCADANCKSVGEKVLLAGKISILLCALPIVERLFAVIQGILQ